MRSKRAANFGVEKGRASGQADRRQRLAEVRLAQKRADRRRAIGIYSAVGLVVVVVVAGLVYLGRQNNDGSQDNHDQADVVSEADLSAVRSYQVTAEHVTRPVTYPQTPPAGGKHNPIWLNCGTYATPVPNENAVHSMEHGAVWITYRPDLPTAQVDRLAAQMPSTYTVLSPYRGLDVPVVASAWGKQLRLDGVDDPRLPAFIRQYRLGSQTPESGAACTGGSDGTLPLDAAGGMSTP